MVEQLSAASAEIAGSRAGAVDAVDALVALAKATNDHVLEPHAERLRTLLARSTPSWARWPSGPTSWPTSSRTSSGSPKAFPTALHDGQVLLLTWAYLPTAVEGTLATDPEPLAALAQIVGSTR